MNDSSPQTKPAGGGMLRKVALFGILFLLVIGLIYDYRVARPSVDLAYDKIGEQSTLVNMKNTAVFTNDDVQALLKKAPSRTFEEANGDFVEVYSWRSGLPIRTHDLFAVYKKNGGKWLFQRHSKFKHEGSTEISKFDGKDRIVIQENVNAPADLTGDGVQAAVVEVEADTEAAPAASGGQE